MASIYPGGDAMNVQVPEGATPGAVIHVQAPNGITIAVAVPDGAVTGSVFQVAVPKAPATAGAERYEPLPNKVYDVTNCCASICCCVKETLILGDQQVKYKMKRPCGTQTTRRPYAELGEIVVNGPDGCGASSLLTELRKNYIFSLVK